MADIGVAGKDVLMEDKKDVFELMDLKLAKCRMVVAVQEVQSSNTRPSIGWLQIPPHCRRIFL